MTGEYILPTECEACGSENIAVRVCYDSSITRYVCLDCNHSRSLPKEENLKKRHNTSLNR
jgi:transposase-like protein